MFRFDGFGRNPDKVDAMLVPHGTSCSLGIKGMVDMGSGANPKKIGPCNRHKYLL